MLEGESSDQPEVPSAVEQVFIEDISVLCSIQHFSSLTSLPVPAAEKQPHSMRLLPVPAHFAFGMVLCR